MSLFLLYSLDMSKPLLSRTATLLTFVLAASSLAPAMAETYIKGTQVSYEKSIDTTKKVNDSSVFVDEANDTENKNYVEFFCDKNAPIFWLNSGSNLINQKEVDTEKTPPLSVQVDGAAPIKMNTVSAEDEGKPILNILALDDKFDAQMLRLFQNAKSKIVVSLTRYDKKTLTFTFYPKGFNEAFKLVNSCQ